MWEKLGTWVRHNLGMTVGIILCVIVLGWTYGCVSTVESLLMPGKKIARPELNIEFNSEMSRLENELTTLTKTYEVREQDLDRQDAFKQQLFQQGVAFAQGGQVNPLGVVMTLGTLLLGGVVIDNRSKDKVIATRTNDIEKITTGTT